MASGRALRPRQEVNYNVQQLEEAASKTPSWLKGGKGVAKEKERDREREKRNAERKSAKSAAAAAAAKQAKEAPAKAAAAPTKRLAPVPKPEARAAPAKRKAPKAPKPKKKPAAAGPKPKKRKQQVVEVLDTPSPRADDAPGIAAAGDSAYTFSTPEAEALRRDWLDAGAVGAQPLPASAAPSSHNGMPQPVRLMPAFTKLAPPAHAAPAREDPVARPGPAHVPCLDPHSRSDAPSSGFADLLDQYNALKNKYAELKASRMSGVQSILEEQSRNVLRHTEASDRLVKHWKDEAYKQAEMLQSATETADRLARHWKDEACRLQDHVQRLEAEQTSAAEVAGLREEIARLKEEARAEGPGVGPGKGAASGLADGQAVLSVLTGLDIISGHKPHTFRACHPRTGFSFELSGIKPHGSEDDIGYTPVSFGTMDAKLPEYLREEIFFDKSQVPILLKNMLTCLNS